MVVILAAEEPETNEMQLPETTDTSQTSLFSYLISLIQDTSSNQKS